jgi:intraflagellar transport protein 172
MCGVWVVLTIRLCQQVSYVLDEALIEFGIALEALAYEHAIAILEPLQLAPETEAMWKQVG